MFTFPIVAVRKVIERGLDATIVNPTGIIGPIDLGPSRMNRVIHSAARGRLPVVVHGGFDWVDVRDVVLGLLAAAEHGRTGENYLLSGHQASAKHLARLAAALNGHLGPVVAIPGKVATWMAPSGEWIGRRLGSDAFTPASIGTLVEHPIAEVDETTAFGIDLCLPAQGHQRIAHLAAVALRGAGQHRVADEQHPVAECTRPHFGVDGQRDGGAHDCRAGGGELGSGGGARRRQATDGGGGRRIDTLTGRGRTTRGDHGQQTEEQCDATKEHGCLHWTDSRPALQVRAAHRRRDS